MFENMLMTSLTPLCNTNEINCWDNQPFATIWPGNQQMTPKGVQTNNIKRQKPKRVRTAFTTEQLCGLEKTYARNRYIDTVARKDLANRLGINEKIIKIWFQNRRMKEKKDLLDASRSSSESSESLPSPSLINQYQTGADETEIIKLIPEPGYQVPANQFENYVPHFNVHNALQPNYSIYDTVEYQPQYYYADNYHTQQQYPHFQSQNQVSSAPFDTGYFHL